MALELTKAQKSAIEEYGKNIIVSAGAGSGKTFVLTERVIYFIKNHGYHLSDFLILTFTNLAAGEMKERIRKKLIENNLHDAALVDTSDICTFDSYALSLVKKYHYLLGVPANISIVDSNIISVRKRTIINELFEELYKNKDEEFLHLIDRFCFNDDEELRTLTFKFYNHALNELDTDFYLDSFIEKYYTSELINDAVDIYTNKVKSYIPLIKTLVGDLPDVPLKKGVSDTYFSRVCELLNSFFTATTYNEVVSSLPEKLDVRAPNGLGESDKKAIDDFKKEYEKLVNYIKKLPESENEFKEYFKEFIPYSKILIRLVKIVDERLKAYKARYQIFEFNDIAKLALNLVKTNIEVQNSLKTSLKMIMIDEYQDTSVLQEAFINLIENNNVYMVGDVKQSIYRFRNARCDIFIDKYDRYKFKGEGLAIDLNKNFRSRREVLDDINYIFKNLMTPSFGGASYIDDHLIECGNSDFEELGKLDVSSHSDFIIHNAKNVDSVEVEASIIARDIIDKINNHYQVLDDKTLRDVKFSDFCILMDRGTEFEDYYKVFSSYQIPLFIDNDENIKNTQIVKLLANILKIVKAIFNHEYYQKEFKKAFVSVARSFLYNYTDEEIYKIVTNNTYKETKLFKTIKESLYNNSSLPLAEKIENLVLDLNIYNRCIKSGNIIKNEKYLDLFINLFKEMTHLDYTLDDFLLYLENIDTYNLKITLSSTGSNIDSVKLMNIHKSKGLEFKIVYFTGLYKGINLMEYKNDFGVSNKYGLIFKPSDENKENILKELNKDLETNEQISESIRLFYVALTRTKEKMIFVLNDEEYASLFDKYNKKVLYSYIVNNNLNNLDLKSRYEIIVNSFLKKEINADVLLDLLSLYGYELDDNFYELKEYELINLTYDYFMENIKMPVDKYMHDLYIEDYMEVLDKASSYKTGHITYQEYINFMNLLGYQINNAYLEEVNMESINLNHLIKNPRYVYNENKKVDFINKLLSSYSDITDILKYYKFYFTEYPNEDYLIKYIFAYNDKLINKQELLLIVHYLGYTFNFNFDEYIILDELNFEVDILPNDKMLNIIEYIKNTPKRCFKPDSSLKLIFKDYLDNKITLEEFRKYIDLFGYTFDINFEVCDKKEELNYTIDDIYKVIVDKTHYDLDYPNMKSFKAFINPFVNSYLFYKRIVDINTSNPVLNIKTSNIEKETLLIKDLNIKNEIIKKFRASKKLDIHSSKKNMEFGTKIHFLLEMIDFKNPNYDLINDEYYISIIKDFLSSDLLENINSGIVYKEYEFYDNSSNTSGIIDLMIIYSDHIDIIDYKTKNIVDDSYLKQLSIYEEFIRKAFNKKVNTYLYSLLDRSYIKCN